MKFQVIVLFALFLFVSAQILPPNGVRRVRPGPTIQTLSGPVQGQEETYDVFRRIITFKGIRYAQPPVGDLRFKQAIPPKPWKETFQAWNYGHWCPQVIPLINRFFGHEDCLFLNIATPTNVREKLPVVVSIHVGGLFFGNADMNLLGPELMVQENVIFVSFNYRLDVLGFLNTGDINSPGNYALKDMIMVLQWVQKNIEYFGGDPDDVTIMGVSGGAVAVHALVVSQAASGLFHKALSQSGSLFNGFGFNKNPSWSVQRLTENLKIEVENSKDLVEKLRQVPVQDLLQAARGLSFLPSIDAVESNEVRIFTDSIEALIENGKINRVPYIIGFNAHEALYEILNVRMDSSILDGYNNDPFLLVPSEWNLSRNTPQAQEVIDTFRRIYFDGATTITPDMSYQYSNYKSDRDFIFGISKQAQLHHDKQTVFYFRFSYRGALNFIQRTLRLTEYPGAHHGDDIFYLYRINVAVTPVLPNNEAFTIQRRYVRMWTNFVKTSTPTPNPNDSLIETIWPTMSDNDEFLDIGRELSADVRPFYDRLQAWHDFDKRFKI